METRKEVKAIKVDFECPKCKKGKLRPTGQVFDRYPSEYVHECNNPDCDCRSCFEETYPYIAYE